MLDKLRKILPENIIFYNEPLKKHSTFRIGGNADVLVVPQNLLQIKTTKNLQILKIVFICENYDRKLF